MATILSNRQEIDTPAAPARRYGLFTAASTLEMDIRGAASGIQWAAEDCGSAVVPYDPTCEAPHAEKPFVPGTDFVESAPYWLLTSYQCGTVGTTAADVARRVERKYRAGVQTRLEDVVWDGGGLANVTPTLTGSAAVTVTPLAPGAGAAIAALEAEFYARHGYLGTIHVNMVAEGAATDAGMVQSRGGAGVLTTPIGSRWSFGAGYGLTGPAGVAPAAGFAWAFMTPQVYLWESQVNLPPPVETLDRLNNQWMAVAETVWMHGWICDTVAAVQIPLAAPAAAAVPAVP